MKTVLKAVGLVILIAFFADSAAAGVISGTVKGPDGSAFMGAFVRAQSAKTRIAASKEGHRGRDQLAGARNHPG